MTIEERLDERQNMTRRWATGENIYFLKYSITFGTFGYNIRRKRLCFSFGASREFMLITCRRCGGQEFRFPSAKICLDCANNKRHER